MSSDDFEEMKERHASGEVLKELVWRSGEMDKYHAKHSHHDGRVADALDGTEIGSLIKNCSYVTRKKGGQVCGSIFCDACRQKRQASMYVAYQKRVNEDLGGDEELARERLRWVTVLHSVVSVNIDTASMEYGGISDVVDAVSSMRDTISKVGRTAGRKYGKAIWMRGGIHLELIDTGLFDFVGLSGGMTPKERTIKEFLDESGKSFGGKAVLVHFHALADTAGISDEEFRNLFCEHWDITTRQVHIQRTWSVVGDEKQDLDDGLLAMSRYCYNGSNARLRFNRNWGGGNRVLESGERVDERGKTIGYAKEVLGLSLNDDLQLSKGDIRLLVMVHQEVSGDAGKGLSVAIY